MAGSNDTIKVPTLGEHSVTKFKVTKAMVHCTDALAEHFVTEGYLKVETFFVPNEAAKI